MQSVLDRLREALAPDFTVEGEIATGGMGTVWRGYDVRLQRRVAIKTLRPELATAVAIERFLREAQYLASLNHPNIVPVHRPGQADGLVYYIMDFVEGATLDTRLAGGALSLSETLALGRGLLSALAAAHAKGIIHRDIKPANIFLAGNRPMLGDFGVAHTASDELTALTQTGGVIGTPYYMSPEQAAGRELTVRSDLYSVGLVLYQACTGRRWERLAQPQEGDWRRVPGRLRAVLWKALESRPEDRWPDAQTFAHALGTARPRPRWPVALLPLLAIAIYGGAKLAGRGRPAARPAEHIAVYPFETVGLADTTFGSQLARVTASDLEALPGISVAPVRSAFREWRASALPPADRLAALAGTLGAKYGVWSVVRPARRGAEVQLQVVNAQGRPVLETVVRGDTSDLIGLSDSIALQLVGKVLPRSEPLYRSAGALSGISAPAAREFLFGEDAFERDALLTAERHYLRAITLDSTFVLAAWRLANARRWMPLRLEPPLPVGFRELYGAHGAKLPPLDRELIEAQFAPSGAERFTRYQTALRLAPRDAYPAFFYGDELFHRGPLSGRSRDEAIAMLRRAVALDSSLAPAHEHLAWALIRSGHREEARASLNALHRVAGRDEESEIYLPAFLELAHALRFTPDPALLNHPALRSQVGLGVAARGGLSVEMPELEVQLGARLSRLPAAPSALHGSGHVAQALGLIALGRPAAALSHFDSAAGLLSDGDEARLQSAQWRVLLPALGVPGVPEAEVVAGRRRLEATSGDRSAWTLALEAYGRGDTAAASHWHDRVGPDTPLDLFLRALRAARAGRFEEALRISEPALAFDSAGSAGDPFFRSALHLERGGWRQASGDPAGADAEWLWYEGLDVVGWPSGVVQAGEVDWALGPYARVRRSSVTPDAGQRCRLTAEALAMWTQPEPAVAILAADARQRMSQCPP
jgi:tRNA A-37 threonylcarbamoyl transferase component Bud32/tetratricopeptide (TPR) repeat protein